MEEMLHQPPMPTLRPQGRRFKLGPALIVALLILPAAGLGLLARTATSDLPLAGAQEGPEVATGHFPMNQAVSPFESLQAILDHPDVIPTHRHPLLGSQAPDFELTDTEGSVWHLRELQDGRPVVLIFYHGYHCVSCVRQLFEINKDLPLFREAGARVVAVSADPLELTRRRFQQHGPFDFPVLSDPDHKVAQIYEVFKPAQQGMTTDILRHGTFVIDPGGTVHWVNIGDAPLRRNPAVLYQVRGTLP
jgi:peroxiredoxin